jgi:hypothetical protein
MKTSIRLLSIVAIVFGLIVIFSLFSSKTRVSAAFAEFPEGQARAIDFEIGSDALATMSRREQLDQLRDWLLFTAVSDAGLSAEEYNQSLFDLPAVRRGYLQPTANFEHGESRSAYIGEGRVVVLVPARIDPKERADQIAHAADLHRKNTGETPRSLIVFDYDIAFDELGDEPSAGLTRRETIEASELFSAKHHYYETTISSLDDLKNFMSWTDDIVFARVDGGALRVGGRKLQGHKYRGIGIEEIAAIWQSEEKIQWRGDPLRKKIDEFNSQWASRTYHFDYEKEQLEAQYQREMAALKREINEAKRGGGFANGSGFSLDPAYDYPGLKKAFDSTIGPICSIFASQEKIDEASRALKDKDVGPLYDLLFEVSQQNKQLADSLEQLVNQDYQFQAARYDGDLRGAEVGMVLFYTDLLAKLWALDFLSSAPSGYVDDFRPMPAVRLSPIYEKELRELSHTRLWFGPQDKGFQVADGGRSLLFAHTATRIYAASANSLQPGKESEPNAQSAAFLGWWDSHYEEVARYEPEYQRLNQIMKWSLLIGWLNQEGRGSLLKSLGPVTVKRDNWFPDWAKQHPELRFRDWGVDCKPGPKMRDARLAPQVCFFPRGYQGVETEAMPRLVSQPYTRFGESSRLSGGVSLAEKTLFKSRTAISAETEVNALLRRSNLKYGIGTSSQGFQTVEGASFGFKAVTREQSVMTATAKDGARLRGSFSEMAGKTTIERDVIHQGAGIEIKTQAGGAEIGRLNIERAGNGFKVGYASREIDAGQHFARTISEGGKKLEIGSITSDPRVTAAIKLPGDEGYAIKLRNTDRWFRIKEDPGSSVNLEEGWQSRVASIGGRTQYKLSWLNEESLASFAGKENFIAVSPSASSEGAAAMEVVGSRIPAKAQPVEAQIGGVKIKALRDPANGKIYVKGGDLAAIGKEPGQLNRLIGRSEAPANTIADAMRSGDYRRTVENMLRSPLEVEGALKLHLETGIQRANRLISEGKFQQAVKELEDLSAVHGQRPEINTLRGLARLSDQSPEVARAVAETMRGGIRNPADFYKEVNHRLARSGLPNDAKVSLVSDGKRVALRYDLSSQLEGAPASPAELRGKNVVVLVQDSPGLNNLNWYINPERAAREAVSLNLGELRRAARADIADFRPSLIYAQESSLATNPATASQAKLYRPHYSYSASSSEPCANKDEDEKKQCLAERQHAEVFVVTPKDSAK